MKKWLVALVIILAVYAGAWSYIWWGPPQLRLVKKHESAFSFANDVHALIANNSGRLPNSWAELEKWQIKESGTVKWTEKGTSTRLLLLFSPYEIIDNVPQYIRVLDPDLKAMEDYINLRIDAACANAEGRSARLKALDHFPS